ncbi:4'-phosphopantetheinyl transferase [Actinoplanes sp. NPDC051494]|uniref:4'-phosphopantetheinyl transferase n=1 Tax=Actinoplanes sp. NPDC051494 TaxID=3363907 RepID=UPI0037AA348B
MIERILPPGVHSAWTVADVAETTLLPGERELIANAVPKRRSEFTAARWCARQALGKLGLPPAPILRGDRGAPIWPAGVVGSMTHCLGYRAAAVARVAGGEVAGGEVSGGEVAGGEVAGVGIDAEVHGALPAGVLEVVSLPEERAHLASLRDAAPEVWWERLLFSAKESVYKVWFPQTGEWLGFEEAAITFEPSADVMTGEFAVRLLRDGPFGGLRGRYLVAGEIVLTAITLPAGPAPAGPAPAGLLPA